MARCALAVGVLAAIASDAAAFAPPMAPGGRFVQPSPSRAAAGVQIIGKPLLVGPFGRLSQQSLSLAMNSAIPSTDVSQTLKFIDSVNAPGDELPDAKQLEVILLSCRGLLTPPTCGASPTTQCS